MSSLNSAGMRTRPGGLLEQDSGGPVSAKLLYQQGGRRRLHDFFKDWPADAEAAGVTDEDFSDDG